MKHKKGCDHACCDHDHDTYMSNNEESRTSTNDLNKTLTFSNHMSESQNNFLKVPLNDSIKECDLELPCMHDKKLFAVPAKTTPTQNEKSSKGKQDNMSDVFTFKDTEDCLH